ncbi:hypothetical protein CQA63_09065 [Helicobacter marmotae]|uniref:Uncharacterized protein n=1 Tax=Helicobacter marmotae TaxID=152490 RepID=A0A3D8I151_9HELI|nr:hypothetical protein CQA63_09065 [Helicobacter marmotae]
MIKIKIFLPFAGNERRQKTLNELLENLPTCYVFTPARGWKISVRFTRKAAISLFQVLRRIASQSH